MLHARKDYNDRVQDSANLIPDDEPVFLLRAQDLLSTEMLDYYIKRTKSFSGHDRHIVVATKAQLMRMAEWREEHACKLADMPANEFLDSDRPNDLLLEVKASVIEADEEEDEEEDNDDAVSDVQEDDETDRSVKAPV